MIFKPIYKLLCKLRDDISVDKNQSTIIIPTEELIFVNAYEILNTPCYGAEQLSIGDIIVVERCETEMISSKKENRFLINPVSVLGILSRGKENE